MFDVHRRDLAKAVEILSKDLKVFSTFNEDLFKEITLLLTLRDFRYELVYLLCCIRRGIMLMMTGHVYQFVGYNLLVIQYFKLRALLLDV